MHLFSTKVTLNSTAAVETLHSNKHMTVQILTKAFCTLHPFILKGIIKSLELEPQIRNSNFLNLA